MIINKKQETAIILFDGDCSFCNATVRFIYRKDKSNYFKFSSLQSAIGQGILKQSGLSTSDFNTFVLYENGVVYTKSTAALRVLRKLKSIVMIFNVCRILPVSFRDFVYDFIAKNRHKIFRKKDYCQIPDKEFLNRSV